MRKQSLSFKFTGMLIETNVSHVPVSEGVVNGGDGVVRQGHNCLLNQPVLALQQQQQQKLQEVTWRK